MTLFFMEIKIYTTENCFYCKQAKELMRRMNQEYIELDRDALQRDHPDLETFPQVFVDGEYIGGLVDSAKYFVDKGMISSKK